MEKADLVNTDAYPSISHFNYFLSLTKTPRKRKSLFLLTTYHHHSTLSQKLNKDGDEEFQRQFGLDFAGGGGLIDDFMSNFTPLISDWASLSDLHVRFIDL
ncbi:hypothetical protein C5167_014582 [Papaver somniferum]|uniref:Uncharacterized protein n=1 Tax=Papaver somniferum TaxID=3469 RepID=A0A4Y7J6R0_PAPSO|nr:hypothetical protein C5167_014582 [Papaver somniferum]